MLPALALFACIAAAAWEQRLDTQLRCEAGAPSGSMRLHGRSVALSLRHCLAVAESAGNDLWPSIVQAVAARIERHPAICSRITLRRWC